MVFQPCQIVPIFIDIYGTVWHGSKVLSFSLKPSLVKKFKALDQALTLKVNELESVPLEERLALQQFARVSTIGASTRIENAVLTDTEILWMDTELGIDDKPTAFRSKKTYIEDKLSKDKERSIEEVAGCRAMLQIIYDQAQDLKPLTQGTLCGLHRELLKEYPPAHHYLGKYKTQKNTVKEINHRTGEERIVLQTSDPGPITEAAMGDLIQWYNKEIDEAIWPFAVACEFVFRFLAIHPFQDGNGRLGRGLFLLILIQSSDPNFQNLIKYIALDRQIERHRPEYYLSLQRTSGGKFNQDPKKYHLEDFTTFMAKMLEATLNDFDFSRKRYALVKRLSEKAHQVYNCFKEYPEKKLSRKEIMGMTNLAQRTINNQLKNLLNKNLIHSIGDGSAIRYQVNF